MHIDSYIGLNEFIKMLSPASKPISERPFTHENSASQKK